MAPVIDHLWTPDVPYTLRLAPCPGCGGQHDVVLSGIGRFMYRCRGFELSGTVDDWPATRRAWELRQPRALETEMEMETETGSRDPDSGYGSARSRLPEGK